MEHMSLARVRVLMYSVSSVFLIYKWTCNRLHCITEYIIVLRTAGLGFYSCGSASRMILARSGRETSTGYTNWVNVFCFMSSLPLSPSFHCCVWVLPVISLQSNAGVGLPNHMIREVLWDPKKDDRGPLGI